MIIIINGTSSSGKSSVCHILQQKLGDGWLLFSTDGFLSMLGDKFVGLHPDNSEVCTPNDICYAKKHKDGTYKIVPGKLCSKLYSTIPDVMSIVAEQGFNIIVDSFITTQEDLKNYKKILSEYEILFVYLYADESVIESREEQRGNRLQGSAIHWLRAFDCQEKCDLAIDTEKLAVEEVSEIILRRLQAEAK